MSTFEVSPETEAVPFWDRLRGAGGGMVNDYARFFACALASLVRGLSHSCGSVTRFSALSGASGVTGGP